MTVNTAREEHRALSLLLAVAMHGLIAALLFFGVQWQTHKAAPVEVELWAGTLAAQAPAEPVPPPVQVEAPRSAVIPDAPEPPKPDIVLEKPKPIKAPPKVLPKPEPKLPLPKKVEPPPKLAAKPTKAEAGMGKLASSSNGKLIAPPLDASVALAALAARQQAAEAAGKAGVVDAYMARVRNQIRRNMIYPDDAPGNPQAEFAVTLLPDMTILSVELKKSSGNPAFDEAAKRAILGTRQYPALLPGMVFKDYRSHTLKYALHDV